jgi:hypothetical protein
MASKYLTVSRPDVVSDHLVDFNIHDRFIKLHIPSYLEHYNGVTNQNIELIESQIALVNAVNDPQYRFIVAALSRRQGKTFVSNMIGNMITLMPNAYILIVAPNYALAEISWREQQKYIKSLGLETVRNNAKDKIMELTNGAMIRIGSVPQVDSCVGRSYDLIIFDEAALDPKGRDAFNIQLRPTLDKPNSKCIFISTPRGRNNYFCEFYERGFDDKFPGWVSIHAPWQANPRANPADIAEAKDTMSSSEFSQEYEASFSVFEGQIYPFDREKHIFEELPAGNFDTIIGIDVGFKDYTAFVVIKYDVDTEIFYVVLDYEENERTTSQHAQALKQIEEAYEADFIFVDAAAAQFREDLAVDYDIGNSKAVKDVLPGIGFVQSLIEQDRLLVHSSCVNVLNMLDQYRWDQRKELTKPKAVHDHYSHSADALRYALYSYMR